MAFNIDFLGRVSSSANTDALKVWTYNGTSTGSDETEATISASGYFDDFMQNLTDGTGPLQVGDVIMIHGNDASGMYIFDSVTTNVTVSSFAAIGTVDTAQIAADAVTNAKIADDAVSLENLDSGIAPSHIVAFAGKESDGGGSATIAITQAGVLATDIVFAQVEASTNAVEVQKVTPTSDTVTVLLSGDPGASTEIAWQVLRAAS